MIHTHTHTGHYRREDNTLILRVQYLPFLSFSLCRCPTCTAQPVCTVPDPPHWATCGPQSTATVMGRALRQPWARHMSLWRTTLKTRTQKRRSAWSVWARLLVLLPWRKSYAWARQGNVFRASPQIPPGTDTRLAFVWPQFLPPLLFLS